MKRILALLLILFGGYGFLSAQNLLKQYAPLLTFPRHYTCYRTNQTIKIDGQLNEQAWQLTLPTTPFVDIRGENHPQPLHETEVRMLWDDKYLYIGAILKEPNIRAHLKQRDTIIYHDNDFEVFLDPNGDGQNYFEIEINALGTLFDLMLDKPYRSGGNFLIGWDCPGLKTAIHRKGTLNDSSDKDKEWSVEIAIPYHTLVANFDRPIQAGDYWRINFSRVQWLTPGQAEENWVWSPTGKIDMHMPERWGFLFFSQEQIDTPRSGGIRSTSPQKSTKKQSTGDSPSPDLTSGEYSCPLDKEAYQLLWALFYAQKEYHTRENNYRRTVTDLLPADTPVPQGSYVQVEASRHSFLLSVLLPQSNQCYQVDQDGRFQITSIPTRKVKNWVWIRINPQKSATDWATQFALLKECGIGAVLFESYDEEVYRLCQKAGLEAHYWIWTMNRAELRSEHPEWYAVNRKGDSSHDKPAYVDYYRFLCPNQPGVAPYLANHYVEASHLPYVDGVHLDYVRFPDVILPVELWKNYGIEQTRELPEYDYCYCSVCRALYQAQTGRDPMNLQYPMESQSWLHFRYDAISRVVDTITRAVKREGKMISGAVFPGPSMARKMVRQDWGNWSLDAYFPMIYNGFYGEGTDWIGRSVRESVSAMNGRAPIYAGLFFPDIKETFEEALDAAYNNGASGISFFDGPDEEHLRMLKAYLQKRGFSF